MPPVRAQAVRPPCQPTGARKLDLRCPPNPDAVRVALSDLRAQLAAMGLTADQLCNVEIATAEALNNIVEHAFVGLPAQDIAITASLTHTRLRLCLRDRGHSLPGAKIPLGARPDATGPRETLPEGGFGWFLIRDVSERVIYRRIGGENFLCVHFRLRADPAHRQKP